ncbi:BamA/TamA family outer membrane protein [Polluticaenibacter yanchengensis]|uniref:BamA/TamA family outer membrane protein n=1 Tax=Polluticaenibacter yanchengensis TaxID=3014562 RepID=A0ABT4UMS3_9BACT|nr:BamA/TamA family outer membrane protein [Chitinophagaceae bacterium LY-5]
MLIYKNLTQVPKSLKLQAEFANGEKASAYIAQLQQLLINKGYIEASVDSVNTVGDSTFIHLYTGRQYAWGNVSINDSIRRILDYQKLPFESGVPMEAVNEKSWSEQLLEKLATVGYPFARIQLDSVNINNNQTIDASVNINLGQLYKIDSLHIQGSLKVKPKFIYPYLQMKKGMYYNQAILDNIQQRLNELPYVEIVMPWQLELLGSGSIVNIFANQRRSNVFDAIIGFMPANTSEPQEARSKLLVTGQVNLEFNNAFGVGENLAINWQQIQKGTPQLKLHYWQPYLAGTQFGALFDFDLFKRDSQFVNIAFKIGMPVSFTNNRSVSVFYEQQNTITTNVDTLAVMYNYRLPDLADITINKLGLSFNWYNTDYKYNPLKGWIIEVNGAAGIKKVKPNSLITSMKNPQNPAFDYATLYDTVTLRSYQVQATAKVDKYFPLNRHSTVRIANQTGMIQSKSYYRNELFMLGGYKTLRGFDEQSIYANFYSIMTAEYRLLTGKNAYFFGFSDVAITQYNDTYYKQNYKYISGGIGINVETKNSLINISWALGKRNDLPFDFRNSKIHIGFKNFF